MKERWAPIVWLMTAAVIVGASIGLSARANAGPVEEYAFLAALDNRGISYTSTDAAIYAGYAICNGLHQGMSIDMVAEGIYRSNNGDLPLNDAYYVEGAAIAAFCPDMAPAEIKGDGIRKQRLV